jgi:hypothetical protein
MKWMARGGLHVADRLNGDRCTYPTCPNALRSSWRLGVRQGGWYVPRSSLRLGVLA